MVSEGQSPWKPCEGMAAKRAECSAHALSQKKKTERELTSNDTSFLTPQSSPSGVFLH